MFAGALYAQPLGVDALNEMRAVAGTRIGIAIVLAYAAWATGWTRRGLAIGCVVFGLTLFGRLLSTTLDGLPTPMLKPEIAEAVLIALALVALRAAPSPEPPLGR
jgi:hydrogenase/urease accessory protein HupE